MEAGKASDTEVASKEEKTSGKKKKKGGRCTLPELLVLHGACCLLKSFIC